MPQYLKGFKNSRVKTNILTFAGGESLQGVHRHLFFARQLFLSSEVGSIFKSINTPVYDSQPKHYISPHLKCTTYMLHC